MAVKRRIKSWGILDMKMKKSMKVWLSIVLILLGGYLFVHQTMTPNKVDSKHQTAQSGESGRSKSLSGKELEAKAKQAGDLPASAQMSNPALILVNKAHPLTKELNFEKLEMRGVPYNGLMKDALTDFVAGAEKAGVPVTIVSAYRSIKYQQTVLDTQKKQYLDQGKSEAEATKLTLDYIQTPGASEHHTGLGVDIMANEYWDKYHALNPEADETKSQQWLIKHAPDYGFILRYPKSAEAQASTGIAYESWHFRYVGVENAKYMTAHHLTLEQYWDLMEQK